MSGYPAHDLRSRLSIFAGRVFWLRHETAAKLVRVVNAAGQALGDRIEIADSAALRRKGLLGRKRLDPGQGLWIVPCESVHTFRMQFAIDLVYLDRHMRVVRTRKAVPPGRISICLRAHSVLELPAGTLQNVAITRGDVLEFQR